MTEARVDQAALYSLVGVIPPARVDQAGLYALITTGVPVRVDQAGFYALVAVTAQVPVAQAGMYCLASGSPCGSKWSQIWTITRTDGEVFRFTSKDTDLEYPPGSGITYSSCDSLNPSASESVSEIDQAGSMDLSGAIGPTGITERDLYSGLFDGAEVTAWLVPWDGTSDVPKRLLKGTFGSVEQMQIGFKVELLGDGAKLQQTPLVGKLQPQCRWEFGDPITCGIDLVALTVTGTIDSATGQRSFVDAARAETAGYFTRGRVTFTTGNNSGISAEIKEHTTGGNFSLWPRLPYAIAAGDQYSMTPGCTNLRASNGGTNGCTAWANEVRYGGFDKVPTGDKRSAGANVRTG